MRSRRKISFPSFFTVLASLLALVTPASASMPKNGSPVAKRGKLRKYVEGELLVRTRASMSTNQTRDVLSKHRASSVKTIAIGRTSKVSRVRFDDGMGVLDKMSALASDPDVEAVQPNYIYHAFVVPNDPRYSQLWGLKNSAQTIAGGTYTTSNPGTAGRDVGAESAWDLITDCSSTIVAVIDSGVNYDHEDLAPNMWDGGAAYPNHGYNFVDNNNDPMDLNGHGTHVAATIGAAGNNGIGSTGVCWRAKIMAVRALDASGAGTTADIVDGISFAVANGAKVINMSLGQGQNDPMMAAAVQSASDAGVVIVVAAGNDGTNNNAAATPTYPCNSTAANLICVAALDQSYRLATFSNYGATSVDVGAPGTNVLSGYAGTETVERETFRTGNATTTNWTTSGGGWAYGSRQILFGGAARAFDMLLNPSDWDGQTKQYANNLDAKAYKNFNLAGYSSAQLGFAAFVDIDAGDAISISSKATGGDPFVGGTALDSFNGSTDGAAVFLGYDLSSCRSANCTIGFRLRTGAATTDFGMAIFGLSVTGLTLNTNSYSVLDGTSMASPHVAGIAAMLFSYNPKFQASDVVNSIKQGGVAQTSLAGRTSTGKAASASGSLDYIAPVRSLQVTAQ